MSFPKDCEKPGSLEECSRGGNNYHEYIWALTCSFFVFTILFLSISMFKVYKNVRNIEERSFHFSFARFSRIQTNYFKRSQRIKIQGILYALVLVLSFIFPLLFYITWKISGIVIPTIDILMGIFVPLQGFFNVLIYLIPVYVKIYKKYKKRRTEAQQEVQVIVEEEVKQEETKEVITRSPEQLQVRRSHLEEMEHEETKEEITPSPEQIQVRRGVRIETNGESGHLDYDHRINSSNSHHSYVETGDESVQEIFDESIRSNESEVNISKDLNFFTACSDEDSDDLYW